MRRVFAAQLKADLAELPPPEITLRKIKTFIIVYFNMQQADF